MNTKQNRRAADRAALFARVAFVALAAALPAQDHAADPRAPDAPFATIRREIASAAADDRRGLESSRHYSLARSAFQAAAAHYGDAERAADTLLHQGKADAATARNLRDEAKAGRIRALLSSADLELIRSDLVAAAADVDAALAEDANDRNAMRLRSTIEIAAGRTAWNDSLLLPGALRPWPAVPPHRVPHDRAARRG